MERFCPKCGSLVSGNGAFCPLCGEAMDAMPGTSVNLSKPADAVPDAVPNAVPNSIPASAPAPAYSQPAYQQPAPAAAPAYQQPAPTATPVYQQPAPAPVVYNNINTNTSKHMTTGQWVLTTFLSGLGIIGLILLFVWAFGDNEYPDKKTYARAMLIWQLVALGLIVIWFILIAALGIGLAGTMGDIYY